MNDIIIIQRICPHYRVPVFRKLSDMVGLIVYHGEGCGQGAFQNAKSVGGFAKRKVLTWGLSVNFLSRSYYICFFPSLIFLLFKDKPRLVVTEGSTNIPNNFIVLLFHWLTGTPFIIWDAGRKSGSPLGVIRLMLEPVWSFIVRQAGAVVTYGEQGREYFKSKAILENRIFVAMNTMEFMPLSYYEDKYKVAARQARTALNIIDKVVILYSGALEPRRNIDKLLLAYAGIKRRFADLALVIMGDGDEEERLRKIADSESLKDVHFIGRKENDAGIYFVMCDMVVLPGWSSLAINQAMAHAKPVISVAYGGMEHELIDNGETGIVVPRDNDEELANALLTLVSDGGLRLRMGARAREKIDRVAGIDNMVSGFLKAINAVASEVRPNG